MPIIKTDDGCGINVEVEGPANAPALILSNSLGTDLHMWDDQAPVLSQQFRLIRYDRRGHGGSDAPKGDYTMDRLGKDVLAIADALGVKTFNWCGLSMGGMVGQWLGANAPDRVERLILSNTHFYYSDKNPWHERMAFARDKGLAALAPMQMERWFTKGFRESTPSATGRIATMFARTPLDGFLGCCAAVRDMDFRQSTPTIKTPTLVIVGSHDPATPPSAGEEIHRMIEGSKLVAIDAAHLSNVEQPKAYLDAMLGFLTRK
jgi:3-oxoadipate enol-lactonase